MMECGRWKVGGVRRRASLLVGTDYVGLGLALARGVSPLISALYLLWKR